MKQHKQRLLHKPDEGQQGDCFRTAIACLIDAEPENLPHFMADPDKPIEQIWQEVDEWLSNTHGLRYLSFPFKAENLSQWLRTMAQSWPGLRWELAGTSPRGTQHSVIVEAGEIVHDPHPDGGGIVGPGKSDGYYWMGFLVPTAVHGVRPVGSRASAEGKA